MAFRIGFTKKECEEVAIVASELATNIVKYGERGAMRFEKSEHPVHGIGLEVTAADVGQTTVDWSTALLDNHDAKGRIDPATLLKRRGIGAGLGAVVRFTDSFAVELLALGKKLRVVRYLKRPKIRRA
jgi:anti-sigma regulatory factor (Ser/Thr protein kinase)